MPVRGAAYERPEHEFVPTPEAPIRALLNTVQFAKVLCDPCCGDGAMLRMFDAYGGRGFGCDIRPDACEGSITCDFIRDPFPFADWPVDIVTNPPFGPTGRLAVRFIDRALQVTRPHRGRVAMLLASDFDSARGRTLLFRDHPAFAGRLILLDRIVWYPGPVPCRACGGEGFMVQDGTRLSQQCPKCKGAGELDMSPAENHTWFWWDWSKDLHAPPVVKYA